MSDDSPGLPAKLRDCGSFRVESTELFIVDGDSASAAVAAARNRSLQAVLPIQGKPLNPLRASHSQVGKYPCYEDIISAMGTGWDVEFDLSKTRYERVVLLFDSNADGIHCSMLVLMFFYRWMRPLLEAGRVQLVRAPQRLETMERAILRRYCLNSTTRKSEIMQVADAEAAIAVFSPKHL